MPTKKDVKRLLKKGLTGKEAARLVLQDSWEVDNEREGFLSDSDIQAVKNSLRTPEDIQEYNKWIDLYRLVDYSIIDAERVYLMIRGMIYQVMPEVLSFYMAERVRIAKIFLPKIVTAQQYEDIKAAQRERHLEDVLSLWELMAWLDEDELAAAETIQEWEQYRENAEDDDMLYEHLFEWLLYEKGIPELGKTYIAYLIQLIQDGKLQPVTFSEAEEERLEKAWEVWRESKKISWHDDYDALKQQIYKRKRAKLTQKSIERLVGKLEQIRDGRMSQEEGEQLLRETYCSGRELYEAGVTPWMEFVDKFKVNYDEPAHSYAIIQEGGLVSLDARGYYNEELDHRMLDNLSRLGMFQQVYSDLDQDEPGSGFVAHLMSQYALIRVRLKNFLAIYSVIEACSEITGIPFIEKLEGWYKQIESIVDHYNFDLKLANLSGQNEYYEGPELKLPLLDISKLKPDPAQLQYMRERMAIALGPEWYRETTLQLLNESSALTAEELEEIRAEQERRGQYWEEFYPRRSKQEEGTHG